jgi:Family of unknown function (DUF6125)
MMKNLPNETILNLGRLSVARLDGAWFMAVARKYGIEAAWEMDVEAWRQFSYVMGKNLRKNVITDPIWPGSFLDALEIAMNLLGMRGRSVSMEGNAIIVRVTDCDIQKAIAKAGIADCGIATTETYKGLAHGVFGKETDVTVRHTKNLNHGDDCCEVVIQLVRSPQMPRTS